MIRLLWKEYREKRLWALPVAASVLVPVLAGQGYTFYGAPMTLNYGWILPSVIVSLLFGMAAYSSEVARGTVDFLYSRPVSWKRIVAARLLFGVSVMVGTVALAAIAYRLTCPEAYVRFATFLSLAARAGIAALLMAVPFLIGLISSVVLPGMVGAVLTFLAIAIAGSTQAALIMEASPNPDSVQPSTLWTAIAWWAGAMLAAAIVLRFGLTLSLGTRIRRYAFIVLAVGLSVSSLDFIVPIRYVPPRFIRDVRLSPNGKYAVVSAYTPDIAVKYYHLRYHSLAEMGYTLMIRLSDMKTARLPYWRGLLQWAGDTAYDTSHGPLPPGGRPEDVPDSPWGQVVLIRMDPAGGLHERRVPFGHMRDTGVSIIPSPDGRRLMIALSSDREGSGSLEFVDVVRGRKLKTAVEGVHLWGPRTPAHFCWWQSSTQVGYIDHKGNRRVIAVE